MSKKKETIITFKADASLMEELQGIDNRSEFIREAILSALDNKCPLCRGTGLLTPEQKRHWLTFAKNHHFHKCRDCEEIHLVCDHEEHEHAGGDADSR